MGTLTKIEKALDNGRPVRIAYVKPDGERSQRTLEVYEIKISKAGDVYVRALDKNKGASRSFRIDRIVSATIQRGRVSMLTRMRVKEGQ